MVCKQNYYLVVMWSKGNESQGSLLNKAFGWIILMYGIYGNGFYSYTKSFYKKRVEMFDSNHEWSWWKVELSS